jgi:hypothetical protein
MDVVRGIAKAILRTDVRLDGSVQVNLRFAGKDLELISGHGRMCMVVVAVVEWVAGYDV